MVVAAVCAVTFHVSPSFSPAYEHAIHRALSLVSDASGMTFTESEDAMMLIEPLPPQQEFNNSGIAGAVQVGGYWGNHVYVAQPLPWAPEKHVGWFRTNIVIHELLHWLGLGHDVVDPVVLLSKPRLTPAERAALAGRC